jgi:hypothetical protein
MVETQMVDFKLPTDGWLGGYSVIKGIMLKRALGEFLRTHRNGFEKLQALLDAVPPDRTEHDYYLARAVAERDEQERAALEHENRQRERLDLPMVTLDNVPHRLRSPPGNCPR